MRAVITQPDHLYDRRSAPLLPLTRGRFHFLHTIPDHQGPRRGGPAEAPTQGVAVRLLSLVPLGTLTVHHGRLVVGDPFRYLLNQGNRWFAVPSGCHPVVLTRAEIGEDERFITSPRAAYVSIVFDEAAVARRQAEQRQRTRAGEDPAIALERVRRAAPRPPAGSLSEAETQALVHPGVIVASGSLALADADRFEALMPPNRQGQHDGWLEHVFEHGIEGSWFDALEAESPWPKDCSNHPLPGGDGDTVVVCPTGWGDGHYGVWEETDESGHLIALHVDFQVIPSDPLANPNWR